MTRYFRYTLLALIIFLAFFFRFYKLSTLPISLSHDEVAIGYNAYSILQTGKDEYGRSLPLLFKSFEDYKLPGYIYSTVISESIFGPTPFAVRFTSAFLGVLTVVVFFFFTKKMLEGSVKNSEQIAFISTALLAISPWHINFSRAAFEANGSLFFIVIGVTFLLYALKRPLFYFLSAIFLVLSVYFYYTARIFLPIILIIFLILYKDQILKYKKTVFLSFILGIILFLPIFVTGLNEGLSRVNQVSIFNDKTLTNPYSEEIVRQNNSISARLIFNRRFAHFQEFSDNYLRNFAPDFLFATGTGPIGLAYIWEAPFFFFGLIKSFSLKTKNKWIVLAWFLSAPLAAGFTLGQPNALRTLANIPPLIIYTSLGIYYFFSVSLFKKYFFPSLAAFLIVIPVFTVRFYGLYFDYNPKFTAKDWGDGSSEMVDYVNRVKNQYDTIYVTGANWRPYIYYLFYSNYAPSKYQNEGTSRKIENITFGVASWDKQSGPSLRKDDLHELERGKTLFVLTKEEFENHKAVGVNLKQVRLIDGKILRNAYVASHL